MSSEGAYQPYISESDSDSEADSGSSSGSESDSSGPSSPVIEDHDRRMQAMDQWRTTAMQWISAPGRAPVGGSAIIPVRPTPVLAVASSSTATASVTDVPTELRANDVRRYILHIDSRFREAPQQSSAGDFYLRPVAPLRNLLRVRVVSTEVPYNYPFFTAARRNLRIDVWDVSGATMTKYPVTVPAGNYQPATLANAVQTAINALVSPAVYNVSYDTATSLVSITSTRAQWSIDTTAGSTNWDRPFDYGLGYYLGMPRGVVDISGAGVVYTAPTCAPVGGDTYLFLKINDFDCVHQPVYYVTPTTAPSHHEFTALAKIRLRQDRNGVAYDDYAGQVLKEVVFQSPRDVSRLHVQLLDAYGEVVDLCSGEFSAALEVLEIKNSTLFDTMRDSIMMQYA